MAFPRAPLIQVELKHAHEELEAAAALLPTHAYCSFIHSAYFAVFHAARAALWTAGTPASHTHVALAQRFRTTFVLPGLVEPRLLGILQFLRSEQEQADYGSTVYTLNQDEMHQLVTDAEQFVTAIDQVVMNLAAHRTRDIGADEAYDNA